MKKLLLACLLLGFSLGSCSKDDGAVDPRPVLGTAEYDGVVLNFNVSGTLQGPASPNRLELMSVSRQGGVDHIDAWISLPYPALEVGVKRSMTIPM